MKMFNWLYFVLMAALLIPSGLYASVLTAKRDKVSVFEKPSKKANVLKVLKKGDEIEAMERKGMYWRVKVEKAEGYVSVLKVKRKPAGVNSLSKAIRAAAQQARSEDGVTKARARSAVMGVRGLSDSDTVSSAGNVSPNTRIIYEMEDRNTSEKDLEDLGNLIYAEVEMRVNKR